MTDYRKIFDLAGRRALVTGSVRGIGAAIAGGLADFGASVAIHGQTASDSGWAVRDGIRAKGVDCDLFAMDLAGDSAGRSLVEEVESDFGAIDILVINASVQINKTVGQMSMAEFQLHLNVNLRSTFEMLQAVLPGMSARGWGRVVNIGSINQRAPKPVVSVYAATKAAQHNLVQSLGREYAPSGVLLNTLAPGLVDTDRNAGRRAEDPRAWDAYVRQLNWMGRAGTVDEMIGAAVFLSSDACSFMTGEAIFPTGGY